LPALQKLLAQEQIKQTPDVRQVNWPRRGTGAKVICRQSTLSLFVGKGTLWVMFFRESIQRQPTWLVLLEALALVGLIGWVDHVTGWELNCFMLYAASDTIPAAREI